MPFEDAITSFTKGVTLFWLGAAQRWKKARAKGPAYTADDMAADLVGFWGDNLDAWAGFAFGPDPLVPALSFIVQKAAIPTTKIKRTASLSPAPPPAVYPCTDLIEAASAATIPSGQLTATMAGSELGVELSLPAATAKGTYSGFVYVVPGSPAAPTVLAQIIVMIV